MTDLSAIYRDDATPQEHLEAMQALVDSGQVWRMEGSMGRHAMALIESGLIMLGPEPSHDYWGNRIPSRFEVVPGTKGSAEYVQERSGS